MTKETVTLIEKMLVKSADALTTARLGFMDGRLDLEHVVRSLDAVGEGISRLTMIADAMKRGESTLKFSTLEEHVETYHVENFNATLMEAIDNLKLA